MPPKKKGKKGKKDKDKDKMSMVDRTFYELTITDLNQKLARLRSHVSGLDESNTGLTEKLREIENDRTDVASHLERVLADRNNNIAELEEHVIEITKVREEENRIATEKINDLEAKYKAMHDQLSSEIKLLNGKLNSLDEFRVQRDVLLAKFDSQEADLKEKEKEQKEALYNMEQKAVVEKDALKKEVEQKLLQVSEDFTRSSEIRNAGYTRRLIRENIALQKEIDLLVMSQIKLQQQYNNQKEKHKEMREQYSALDQIKNELVRNSVNKIKIIEGLTTNYEKLKAKYVEVLRFRKAYEAQQHAEQCELIKQKDSSAKYRVLSKRMEIMSLENKHLVVTHEQHEMEILRLRGIIQQIKVTVRDAIISEQSAKLFPERLIIANVDTPEVIEEVREDAMALCKLTRIDLLSKLMDIVSSHSKELPRTPSIATIGSSTSSIYVPGKMGLMQHRPKPKPQEIFRSEVIDHVVEIPDYLQKHREKDKGQERTRFGDGCSIIDVEYGTTLYASSSREDDLVEMEDEPLEEPEGSSSSVSVQKLSSEGTEPPPALAPLARAKSAEMIKGAIDNKSAHSIVTLNTQVTGVTGVTSDGGEGEEGVEEEEDFEINLFY